MVFKVRLHIRLSTIYCSDSLTRSGRYDESQTMAEQIAIPCLFMRAGTSRGPFFNRNHLPEDLDQLAKVLVAAVGAGHRLNINGMGGGVAVTTKVAMVSPSQEEWADVDYFFAQVNVEDENVDFSPTCGNMLSGIGPAAIEMGLVPASKDKTTIKIRSINTGARIEAIVETPHDPKPRVEYEGSAQIDGVPGTAAAIQLNFMDVVGSKTNGLLPTGKALEQIDGTDTTLIDVAVPMMMLRAEDMGKTGYETAEDLTADRTFMDRLETLRLEAGERMGLGDVSKRVVPKVGLVSKPRNGGSINIRYFMPWQCHPSLAVTGSMAFAGCTLLPGTVADGLSEVEENASSLLFEHPMGDMEVTVDYSLHDGELDLRASGSIRTTRLLMRGELLVPSTSFD